MSIGYLLPRFSGREADAESFARLLTELVETDPRNALPDGFRCRIWDPPLVGVASAGDPQFAVLREPGVVGPIHRDPSYWLDGARSVVSFFLPFSSAIKARYRKKAALPPFEWVSGRVNGEVFVNVARRTVAAHLRRIGGRAVVPTLQVRAIAPSTSSPCGRSAMWPTSPGSAPSAFTRACSPSRAPPDASAAW